MSWRLKLRYGTYVKILIHLVEQSPNLCLPNDFPPTYDPSALSQSSSDSNSTAGTRLHRPIQKTAWWWRYYRTLPLPLPADGRVPRPSDRPIALSTPSRHIRPCPEDSRGPRSFRDFRRRMSIFPVEFPTATKSSSNGSEDKQAKH